VLEEAGPGINAVLEVDVAVCTAWPQLVGMDRNDASNQLRQQRPDLTVEMLELQGGPFPVVSWDRVHKEKGYPGKFFGSYEEDLRGLKKGDTIDLNGRHFTFSHVDGKKGDAQKVNGRLVRYAFVLEDCELEGKKILDGMQWKKVVEDAAPGFQADRVCLYFDPVTNLVAELPRTG